MIEFFETLVDVSDILDVLDRDLETSARFFAGFLFAPKGGFGYIPIQ